MPHMVMFSQVKTRGDVTGSGTYRIIFAAQFYIDALSFIGFGEFSCAFGSKHSSLSSQHGWSG